MGLFSLKFTLTFYDMEMNKFKDLEIYLLTYLKQKLLKYCSKIENRNVWLFGFCEGFACVVGKRQCAKFVKYKNLTA